jgi:sialidase-1
LAIFDARYESARDLQGHMDIALHRSRDGGHTWEPLQVVLDRGEWGGLPEKYNGVSDACILVDDHTGDIYVAGLWMHGVLDRETGHWVEGMTADSTRWIHQWQAKGSQPGYGVKETSQFLITKSSDDGLTWSEPVNITRAKKEAWWLFAPAPGRGITLKDGTLVFPTQGRDENGLSFSNITWSNDGGKTWITGNPATKNTTECAVVELGNGELMLNMRDNRNRGNEEVNGRSVFITHDLGETWAEHPTSRKALIEPTCMGSLHKHHYTENGEEKSLLLFVNPASATRRNNITLKVSYDEGNSWPEEKAILLDAYSGRGYSCITSVNDSTIGILYESSQADMVFQTVQLKEIR